MLSNAWQKSPASQGNSNCLEARIATDLSGEPVVEVRNSKRPNQRPTEFTPAEWSAFLAGVDTFALPDWL